MPEGGTPLHLTASGIREQREVVREYPSPGEDASPHRDERAPRAHLPPASGLTNQPERERRDHSSGDDVVDYLDPSRYRDPEAESPTEVRHADRPDADEKECPGDPSCDPLALLTGHAETVSGRRAWIRRRRIGPQALSRCSLTRYARRYVRGKGAECDGNGL